MQRDGKEGGCYREEIKVLQPPTLRAVSCRTPGSLIGKVCNGNLQKSICGEMCVCICRGRYYVQFSKLD